MSFTRHDTAGFGVLDLVPQKRVPVFAKKHMRKHRYRFCTGPGRSAMLGRRIALAALLLPSAAVAADVEAGRDIAHRRCTPCHIVAPHQRSEVAQAPPFDTISKKEGFDAAMLVFWLLEPHPKMNLALTRREATDVAAYIGTLAK
jgi:mono/diheme cytochrome c family protein